MSVKISEDAQQQLGDSLDEALVVLLDAYDWEIFCPDGYDETDHYEHMRRGRCMLCGDPLGEDTIIPVDAQGILGMFCGAECIQDMHIIPYLNEQIEDKLARVMAKGEDDAEDQ